VQFLLITPWLIPTSATVQTVVMIVGIILAVYVKKLFIRNLSQARNKPLCAVVKVRRS